MKIFIISSILYVVYVTTFCCSQNNRITWQNTKITFSFKIVLDVMMSITQF